LKLSRASEKLTTCIALSNYLYNSIGGAGLIGSGRGSHRLPVLACHGVPVVPRDDLCPQLETLQEALGLHPVRTLGIAHGSEISADRALVVTPGGVTVHRCWLRIRADNVRRSTSKEEGPGARQPRERFSEHRHRDVGDVHHQIVVIGVAPCGRQILEAQNQARAAVAKVDHLGHASRVGRGEGGVEARAIAIDEQQRCLCLLASLESVLDLDCLLALTRRVLQGNPVSLGAQ